MSEEWCVRRTLTDQLIQNANLPTLDLDAHTRTFNEQMMNQAVAKELGLVVVGGFTHRWTPTWPDVKVDDGVWVRWVPSGPSRMMAGANYPTMLEAIEAAVRVVGERPPLVTCWTTMPVERLDAPVDTTTTTTTDEREGRGA